MKQFLILLVTVFTLAVPVSGMEFTAPSAPEAALEYLPDQTENFGDGLLYIFKTAISSINPVLSEVTAVCLSLLGTAIVVGVLGEICTSVKPVVELTGTVVSAITLFRPTNSLVKMGAETVIQISQYGKLLLPVMTGAMAAQGGITKSGALYAATAFFDALLSEGIQCILIPLVYLFLCICMTASLFRQPVLINVRKFIKWLVSWILKTSIYIFTGYISITGVVGGSTDATILKATKLTISGMVPVVGGILSDASEAVLVSAGIMKNAAGIYGMLTIIAIWIGPFIQIGVQYILLKITSGICEMLVSKQMTEILKDFSSAMGFLLAMTSTECMIFIISTICFMKGVT